MTTYIRAYMLQAYLNGELDAETQAEFELEILQDPELADLVAADTALILGLSSTHASVATREISSDNDLARPASNSESVLNLPSKPTNKPIKSRSAWPHFAAAASILMFIAGAIGYSLKPNPQILGGAQLAYIDKQRSADNAIQITLPEAGPMVLMVPVASATECLADIAITQLPKGAKLENPANTIFAQAQPDNFGYAVVVLANDALKPGNAMVSVGCHGKELGQYPVAVLDKPHGNK